MCVALCSPSHLPACNLHCCTTYRTGPRQSDLDAARSIRSSKVYRPKRYSDLTLTPSRRGPIRSNAVRGFDRRANGMAVNWEL